MNLTSMTPSPRARTTSLSDLGILLRLPGGRPGPGLVPFAKCPSASRFSSPRVSSLAAGGVWSALVRIWSRSLSTACWAFVGTPGRRCLSVEGPSRGHARRCRTLAGGQSRRSTAWASQGIGRGRSGCWSGGVPSRWRHRFIEHGFDYVRSSLARGQRAVRRFLVTLRTGTLGKAGPWVNSDASSRIVALTGPDNGMSAVPGCSLTQG